jgi:hypothetical protein
VLFPDPALTLYICLATVAAVSLAFVLWEIWRK